MSTAPRFGYTELTEGQDVPEVTVNEMLRYLIQGAGHFIIKSRATATPPGSPAQSDAYLIPASPTGDWAAHTGKLTFYQNTGWIKLAPWAGLTAYVADEQVSIIYDGTSWNPFGPGAASGPTTQSGTTYTAVRADAGGYILFTNASPVTFTIPPEASVSWPAGSVLTFEQNGAGAVTVSPGAGVTIHSRGSLYTSNGQYAVCQLKKVGTNIWTMTGDLT
ncbi:DUF2793 domain-containing protein [Sphingobium sp. MI1205]|uniref:DUF2793 domain-containing protein n=1 Tax=Sphingobium sp. MI1205 TaxID=407020 RepID=UPI00076FF0BA|nr:DUF2793 domain-containing protein [Sphingobium sp. MI1205]AMK19325.1 hypothetical protein K663_14735 [Sphingobium sp. MI1205]